MGINEVQSIIKIPTPKIVSTKNSLTHSILALPRPNVMITFSYPVGFKRHSTSGHHIAAVIIDKCLNGTLCGQKFNPFGKERSYKWVKNLFEYYNDLLNLPPSGLYIAVGSYYRFEYIEYRVVIA